MNRRSLLRGIGATVGLIAHGDLSAPLQAAIAPSITLAPPAVVTAGSIWLDTAANTLRVFNGAEWVDHGRSLDVTDRISSGEPPWPSVTL